MIKILNFKSVFIFSILLFLVFDTFGQTSHSFSKRTLLMKRYDIENVKDLPEEFSEDQAPIILRLMDVKIERKKNGKKKYNKELAFNESLKKVLASNVYSGKIITKTESEFQDFIVTSNSKKVTYKYVIDFIQIDAGGTAVDDYLFYIYNVFDEEAIQYSVNSEGSSNYKSALERLLKKLEKAKLN